MNAIIIIVIILNNNSNFFSNPEKESNVFKKVSVTKQNTGLYIAHAYNVKIHLNNGMMNLGLFLKDCTSVVFQIIQGKSVRGGDLGSRTEKSQSLGNCSIK